MVVALAADHTGLLQLKQLREYLEDMGHECEDFGPRLLVKDDDYPDYVFPAAHAVAEGKCDRGVILGGSGQGEAMAANRVKGVRCAVFYSPAVAKRPVDIEGHLNHDPYEMIRLSRQHNDSNMLSLSARFLSIEDMKMAVKLWLETDFSGEPRHKRRIVKLDKDK